METNPLPRTWLLESILVTLFCCLPFGIVGIVNASKVSSTYATGQYELARRYSAEAQKWTIIGAVTGFIAGILYLVYEIVCLLI